MTDNQGSTSIERLELEHLLYRNLYRYGVPYPTETDLHLKQVTGELDLANAAQLEADFIRTNNPVFAWEALTIFLRNGRELPDWIAEFLSVAGRRVVAIAHHISDDGLEEVGAGEATRSSTEAEKVGKAMGFGSRGPGRGSCFEDARTLRRDRIIRSAIEGKLAAGFKKDFAYDEIASEVGVSRSTVQRAYVNGAGS